jgi:hypothetical protein
MRRRAPHVVAGRGFVVVLRLVPLTAIVVNASVTLRAHVVDVILTVRADRVGTIVATFAVALVTPILVNLGAVLVAALAGPVTLATALLAQRVAQRFVVRVRAAIFAGDSLGMLAACFAGAFRAQRREALSATLTLAPKRRLNRR